MSKKRSFDKIEEPTKSRSKRLKKDSDDEYIDTTLTESLSSLSLSEDESEYKPNDYSCYLQEEVSGKEFDILNKELVELTKHIEYKKITLVRILKSSLSSFEKQRAIELYGVLCNTEENTLAYLELTQMLQNMIEGPMHQSCTLETKEKLEKLENNLRSESPTIDKIVNASINEEDKMLAIQYYYLFIAEPEYSYDWFSYRKKV